MSDPAPAPRRGFFQRWWGAGPLHLIGHLALIVVAAFALSVMFEERFAPRPWNLLLWLLGGAVLHDAVFLPAYSAINIVAARVLRSRPGAKPGQPAAVPVLNYVRWPAVISGILLLTFSPRIFNGQPQNFERALGQQPPDYLGRWLAVTAAIFAISALLYVVQRIRVRGRASPDPSAAPPAVAPTP